ncbi:MAG: glutamine synthetase family protein [Alphaproteobacteria bacterium]|nr:glutamine synthetase family protein [Alphaproteobacteria bacterium]
MSDFDALCGLRNPGREAALQAAAERIRLGHFDQVRIMWCDLHGLTRGKALMPSAALRALRSGISMVSTLMLKDTSDRTAFKVFEPGGTASLPGFGQANNLMLMPDPASLCELPFSPGSAWMRAQPFFQDGTPVDLDPRQVLQQALQRLAQEGYGLRCGLEVEFHIYRITDDSAQMDPARAEWPGVPPEVALIHPGYKLLSEDWYDMAQPALQIVQQTALGLGLPLSSLELEMGPSQVEAVFDATDALSAADHMVLFRNAVRMALRRAGYHASFVCLPPFGNLMCSGWHLHQSLVRLSDGQNAMRRDAPAPGAAVQDASFSLSDVGEHWLAGLLAHAPGMTALCVPTTNGYGRFRPNALAPQSVLWGRDNRGALLRVIGGASDPGTRIENRMGEPAANPYLYLAAQIHAGLDGIEHGWRAPPGTDDPYAPAAQRLPTSLAQALQALADDSAMVQGLGADFVAYFSRIKAAEVARFEAAQDPIEFQRSEYFSRY